MFIADFSVATVNQTNSGPVTPPAILGRNTVKRTKSIAIAIAMALALTATIGAASASATQFRAEEYPTSVSGTQTGTHIFTVTGGKNPSTVSCKVAKSSGTISEAASTLTVTPTYEECNFDGFIANGRSNSCTYVFHSTTETAPYTGNVDISCSKEGDAIEFGGTCALKFPAQTARATMEFSNSGGHSRNRTITATFNISGLKYSKTGFGCSGGNGTFENGTYKGTVVIKGEKSSHAAGVYLASKQEESPAEFEAEEYPSVVEARGSANWLLSISNRQREYSCSPPSGNGELSAAGSQLSERMSQNLSCFWFSKFTLKTNGCSLTLSGVTSEPSESGTVADGTGGISCPSGHEMEFIDFYGCHVTIPSQSGLGSVHFKDLGAGATRSVTAEVALGKMKYTSSGAGCPKSGTYEDGSLEGTWSLTGYKLAGTQEKEDGGGHYLEYIPGLEQGLWID